MKATMMMKVLLMMKAMMTMNATKVTMTITYSSSNKEMLKHKIRAIVVFVDILSKI